MKSNLDYVKEILAKGPENYVILILQKEIHEGISLCKKHYKAAYERKWDPMFLKELKDKLKDLSQARILLKKYCKGR
jgi:hypothetical protein